jgi:hypothetical protein
VGLTGVCMCVGVMSRPQAKQLRPTIDLRYHTPPSLSLTMASSSSSSPELSHPSHTHPPNPYKYSTIEEVLDDLSR